MEYTIIFDVETTGLSSSRHSIHQLAGVVMDETNLIVDQFDFKIAPYAPEVNKDALAVGKVTEDQIRQYPSKDEVLPQIIEYFSKYAKDTKIIPMGYNVTFDIRFLKALLGSEQYDKLFDYHHIDVMSLAIAHCKKYKIPTKYNLGAMCRTLHISLSPIDLHEALYDSLLTLQLYHALI